MALSYEDGGSVIYKDDFLATLDNEQFTYHFRVNLSEGSPYCSLDLRIIPQNLAEPVTEVHLGAPRDLFHAISDAIRSASDLSM